MLNLPILAFAELHRFALQVEEAMFPMRGEAPILESYELFLNPDTRIQACASVPSERLRDLRLSGTCNLPNSPSFPALQHLSMTAVKGNYFESHLLDACFHGAQLQSFTFVQAERLGFELRDENLRSLVRGPGACLHTLVLRFCGRLTSSALTECLRALPILRHFTLSLIASDDLLDNFVLALPATLDVLNLQISHVWYRVHPVDGVRALCDALEERFLLRRPPLQRVRAAFAPWAMSDTGRRARWEMIAQTTGLDLTLDDWDLPELHSKSHGMGMLGR
jgi:hypothetical protein